MQEQESEGERESEGGKDVERGGRVWAIIPCNSGAKPSFSSTNWASLGSKAICNQRALRSGVAVERGAPLIKPPFPSSLPRWHFCVGASRLAHRTPTAGEKYQHYVWVCVRAQWKCMYVWVHVCVLDGPYVTMCVCLWVWAFALLVGKEIQKYVESQVLAVIVWMYRCVCALVRVCAHTRLSFVSASLDFFSPHRIPLKSFLWETKWFWATASRSVSLIEKQHW